MKGSPVDPNRIFASQSSGWFGQVIHRSDDGGKNWETVGNEFGSRRRARHSHQWYVTARPIRGVHPRLAPGAVAHRSGHGLRRVEDAALFRTTDGGQAGTSCPGLRQHGTGPMWQLGAGGICLHSIVLDPSNEQRMHIAILGRGQLPHRRRRRNVAAHQPGP